MAWPLGRAHAHHLPLGAFVPAATALPRELFAGRVPNVLGVDEDAVQVEDDGPESRQSPVAAVHVDEGGCAPTVLGRDDFTHEERVVAGRAAVGH